MERKEEVGKQQLCRKHTRKEEAKNQNAKRQNARVLEEEKRDQIASMSAQIKRRINERRRSKCAEKQQEMKEIKVQKIHSSSEVFASDDAERKVIVRARQLSPSTPKRFANVIAELAVKASPTKRKALDDIGTLIVSPSKKMKLEEFKETVCNAEKELSRTKK